MSKYTDIRVLGASLYFLPVQTRLPLKFGPETLTHVTCARVHVRVIDGHGRVSDGWGETPLSVQWVWPSRISISLREEALRRFCALLVEAWVGFNEQAHPIELGFDFAREVLPSLLAKSNLHAASPGEPIPWLAALVCCSPFDQAIHDAYGHSLQRPVYETYSGEFMNRDLAAFLQPADDTAVTFSSRYPSDFLRPKPLTRLRAWHLVGGLDLLEASQATGEEPRDGYPVFLHDWITRDQLKCLKVKLRGNDAQWDYHRLEAVGSTALQHGVDWLSADFNCTVLSPEYVNEILDHLREEHPRLYGMILYVEQPFPYDLEQHRIDVHSVSARKPLFLDESAHDWQMVRLGRSLGWNGVALKTCKTQSGALLTACWAQAHGMSLMVQDLTNPMLAQIPHLLLAASAETIMGVETNSMQFYPEASRAEATIHPGLYQRVGGTVDLRSLRGPGFGYRLAEIRRILPPVAAEAGG